MKLLSAFLLVSAMSMTVGCDRESTSPQYPPDRQSNVEAMANDVEDLQSDISAIKTQLDEIKSAVDDVQSTMSDLSNKFDDVKNAAEQIQITVDDLNGKVDDVQSELDDIKSTVDDIQFDVEKMPEGIAEPRTPDAPEVTAAFSKAEGIYKTEIKKENIAEWNLDEAYKLYVMVMEKTNNPSLLSRCRSRLSVIRKARRYQDAANTPRPGAK